MLLQTIHTYDIYRRQLVKVCYFACINKHFQRWVANGIRKQKMPHAALTSAQLLVHLALGDRSNLHGGPLTTNGRSLTDGSGRSQTGGGMNLKQMHPKIPCRSIHIGRNRTGGKRMTGQMYPQMQSSHNNRQIATQHSVSKRMTGQMHPQMQSNNKQVAK